MSDGLMLHWPPPTPWAPPPTRGCENANSAHMVHIMNPFKTLAKGSTSTSSTTNTLTRLCWHWEEGR